MINMPYPSTDIDHGMLEGAIEAEADRSSSSRTTDVAQEITLISSTPDGPIVAKKEILSNTFPYFESLFNSSFADADRRVFEIERFSGTCHEVEVLLFVTYAHDPAAFTPAVRTFLRDRKDLRSLVGLNRLANYYGVDLQGTCEEALLHAWRTRGSTLTPRRLESFLKTCRALAATATERDGVGVPIFKTRIFSTLLEHRSSALGTAWAMSRTQQEKFWTELLGYSSTAPQYPGLVLPYFRILQSLPARPPACEDFVLGALASALDETHFVGLRGHRESNGHQHGDLALHPDPIVARLRPAQLLWCWREWSDSDRGRDAAADTYRLLLHRLAHAWTAITLDPGLAATLAPTQSAALAHELAPFLRRSRTPPGAP
ncbi:protein of unknown function [Taphrina deformans PYCC 5710]|uniref:BTB domain-containing protein n=1 Tax=Taphrina deformans (strain PYCC 5710 / ATCC 11124 / CBS 356.35 / IMI 108563 / JCM 9778 / NBRC 8474) TaxID=1097556 RepID=R4X769_TAPDE|nr:protein of unknown function [Taphrina deformans PYCC 5710]|eukprot:CCG81121.1 protein of unknown function [Taphrina deformans PYCC 5710]